MKKFIRILIIIIISICCNFVLLEKTNVTYALFMEPYIYTNIKVRVNGMPDENYTIEYNDSRGVHSVDGNKENEHKITFMFDRNTVNIEEQRIKFLIKYDNRIIKETKFVKVYNLKYEKETNSYIYDINCNPLKIANIEQMSNLIVIVSGLFIMIVALYIILITKIKRKKKNIS